MKQMNLFFSIFLIIISFFIYSLPAWPQAFTVSPLSFTLRANRSGYRNLEVTIANNSADDRLTCRLKLSDVRQTARGGLHFPLLGSTEYSAGPLLTLPYDEITVAPNSKGGVRLRVKLVPGMLGSRHAVLLVTPISRILPRPGGAVAGVVHRFGVLINLMGRQPPQAHFELVRPILFWGTKPLPKGGFVPAWYYGARVKNPTPAVLWASGKVKLLNASGQIIHQGLVAPEQDPQEVYPGGEYDLLVSGPDYLIPGTYRLDATIGAHEGKQVKSAYIMALEPGARDAKAVESAEAATVIVGIGFTPGIIVTDIAPGAVRALRLRLENNEAKPVSLQFHVVALGMDSHGQIVELHDDDPRSALLQGVTLIRTPKKTRPNRPAFITCLVRIPAETQFNQDQVLGVVAQAEGLADDGNPRRGSANCTIILRARAARSGLEVQRAVLWNEGIRITVKNSGGSTVRFRGQMRVFPTTAKANSGVTMGIPSSPLTFLFPGATREVLVPIPVHTFEDQQELMAEVRLTDIETGGTLFKGSVPLKILLGTGE